MFLRRERPETDDFVRKNISGVKEKYFHNSKKYLKSFSRHPYKIFLKFLMSPLILKYSLNTTYMYIYNKYIQHVS